MLKKTAKTLLQIINILQDGQCHDGTSMGQELGMTRSAVWKIIKKLIQYGVKIECVKGKGYILSEPCVLLDATQIKKYLHNQAAEIHLFESIPSTNDYLKSFKNATQPLFCIAEQQTKGKGRFDREWYSPFAKNIYFSCLYPFQKDVSELAGLSLVIGLAVKQTLVQLGIHDELFVKWSNDIIHQQNKLSGILIEVMAETHAVCHTIIGIGINVNMLIDENQKISQQWTSIQKIMNQYIDRNYLCGILINHVLAYLQRFNDNGFAPFVNEWMNSDYLMNKIITLKTMTESITGIATGISDQGHLLLRLDNGQVRAFSSGDVSLLRQLN